MKTTTKWKKKHEFESWHEHNKITLDGDKQHGNGPKSLLLSALAGCSGVDVVDILEKKKVEFSEMTIHVETEQTDGHPKVFKDIYIHFQLRTGPGNEQKIKKAIELSLDKYCGVAAMLKKNSSIHYTLEILK